MRTTAEPTADEIRRVALEMFSARGFHATSVRDISEAVGIRGSSMYNHFASKEAILWDLTQRAFAQLWQGWADERAKVGEVGPDEKLVAFVQSDVRYHAQHQPAASIINAQLGSLSAEHYARAIALRDEYEAEARRLVEACLATSRAPVPQSRLAVYAILQMCSGVAHWYDEDGPLEIDEVCDTYAKLALKMLA